MLNTAIKVSHLTKIYKLYDKPSDRLKESLYALNDVSFEIKGYINDDYISLTDMVKSVENGLVLIDRIQSFFTICKNVDK